MKTNNLSFKRIVAIIGREIKLVGFEKDGQDFRRVKNGWIQIISFHKIKSINIFQVIIGWEKVSNLSLKRNILGTFFKPFVFKNTDGKSYRVFISPVNEKTLGQLSSWFDRIETNYVIDDNYVETALEVCWVIKRKVCPFFDSLA
jgi:hypothetical protein